MNIDEIYDEFHDIGGRLQEKARAARATAKAARKAGNTKKWDKFNSVARVYEMIYLDVIPLGAELVEHLSDERKEQMVNEIPF